ncbi:MAG: amidohydrolase family protein [Balneolales bacterium]
MKKKLNLYSVALIIITALFFNACEEDFYGIDDFQSVDKIDTHVHINVTNPAMVEQALSDNFELLTVNVGSGRIPIEEQKEVAIQLEQQYPDHINFITTLPYDNWDNQDAWESKALAYLEESFDDGALGVKVWKNIGMELKNENDEFVMVDDPQFDPIFEYLSDQGKPLFGHIGEPRNCWLPLEEMTVANDRQYFEEHPEYHMHLHPEYPSYEEIIQARDNMLDKHPDLKFFGAHLGSMEWSIEMMAEHLDRYPNMVLGMAHRVPHLQYLAQEDREKLRNFIIAYQDRFLYSTDLSHHDPNDSEEASNLARETWRSDWEFFVTDNDLDVWQVEGSFQGLQLPKEVVDKIYYDNAKSFFPGL